MGSPEGSLLDGHPILRTLLFNPVDDAHPILQYFPPTMRAAVVLAGAGVALLAVVLRREAAPRGPTDAGGATSGLPFLSGDWAFTALLPAGSLAIFGVAQWKGALFGAAMPALYATLLVAGLAVRAKRDLRFGIDFWPHLSLVEGAGLALGSAGLLGIYARGLDSWKFSYIGDEWAFYDAALRLGANPISIPWLNANGVYGHVPVAPSGWQAVCVRVFGMDNFGWRISMSLVMVACLPPLYLILRHMAGFISPAPRIAAALGCVWFCLSEFIVVWARIGKPLAIFVLPMVVATCCFLAAMERRSPFLFLSAGLVSGVGCLMSSLSAALPMVVLCGFLFVAAAAERRAQRDIRGTLLAPLALIVSGFLAAGAPILVQIGYWHTQIQFNFLDAEAASNRHLFLPKLFAAPLMFLTYRADNHFLWKNVVDPVTAVFAAGGLGMARLLGSRRWLFPLWCLLSVTALAGAASRYGYPPATRMLVSMVPVVILATIGFAGLTRSSSRVAALLALFLAPLCAAYNILKLEEWNPYLSGRDYPMIEMQRIQEAPSATGHLLVSEPNGLWQLEAIVPAYHYAGRVLFFDTSATGLARLREALDRGSGNVEARLTKGAETPEVLEIIRRSRARLGPRIEWSIPARSPRSPDLLFAFFSAVNRG